MSLANSSAQEAVSNAKADDCRRAGEAVVELIKRGIKPSDILSKEAFENAITTVIALGGSTNAVLHLLAVAKEAGVKLDIDEFDRISRKTPLLADMKPWGTYTAPEMHEAARQRQLMESDLRVALEKGQLRVVYQPQVDASSEAVTGFEALVRWDHPEHGPVSPAVFIPLAEEIRLIDEIGEWVLRTACAEAVKWPPHISVAVNLSPVQFKSPALPSVVRMVLGDTELAAKRLELEITEGVFPGRQRHHRGHVRAPEIDRREAGARRFRYRLFLARLFEEGSVRQDQDRSELRPRRGLDHQAQRRDHSRHCHPRRKPGYGHHRRGR